MKEYTPMIMERRSLLFYFAATVIALAIIILSVSFSLKLIYGGCEIDEICLTPECVQLSSEILSYVDPVLSPCENFYAFACGKFLSNVEDVSYDEYVSTSSNLHNEQYRQLKALLEEDVIPTNLKYIRILKTYYQACNNIAAIEQLGQDIIKTILKQVGGWPVLDGYTWQENTFSWYNYIYKLNELGINTNFFVTINVVKDAENSTRRLLQIGLPELSLSSSTVTWTGNEFVRMYYHYMVSVAKKMGAIESRAVEELNQSLEFEMSLGHIAVEEKKYLRMTISELDNKYPNIAWFEYIRGLVSPFITITKHEEIIVAAPEYIRGLDVILRRVPKRVQANYIMWKTVESLASYLNEEIKERTFAYESVIHNTFEKPNRWQQCIEETYDKLPDLLSLLYLKNNFDFNSKQQAVELVNNIKNEFLAGMKDVTWINSRDKSDIEATVSKMTVSVGYPDKLLDTDALEQTYDELEINANRYLESYLNISILNKKIFFIGLRKPNLKDEKFDTKVIAKMHTLYSSNDNSLTVSAGALQGLLFSKDYPDYLNYGGIGFSISRELVKQFYIWKANSSNVASLQCFVDQYSKYIIQGIGQAVNGTVTLIDNVADNLGLHIAYKAYKEWIYYNSDQKKLAGLTYSPEQLFWISFAINLCSKESEGLEKSPDEDYKTTPAEFKVIGATTNSKDFVNDFNCASVAFMNRGDKCTL